MVVVINTHPALASSLPSILIYLMNTMPAHMAPSLRDSCHCHTSRARLPPPFWIRAMNNRPALDCSLPHGSPSLTPAPCSVLPPFWISVIFTRPTLGRALWDYGHRHPVHGVDGLDPTLFAVHSHSGLGSTPTLLIRHPCAHNKIVRYFEFLSNQRSHKWYLIGPGRKM